MSRRRYIIIKVSILYSDPAKEHEALAGPDPEPMKEDQTGSDSRNLHVSLAGPNPEHMDDEFLATAYPKTEECQWDKEVCRQLKEDHKRKHDSDDDEDDDDNEGPSAGSNQGKSSKRRRHDSGASGLAQPPTKDDEQSSKKHWSLIQRFKQHPSSHLNDVDH
ncbi:hypothetical protein Tco_1456999 [Tanacetum coccineum]